ncbi:hydroxyacid dehydrogenase [Nesterenkonia sp. Hz 6-5]|nr:hydroxyacid dehydrogenase [Nesterenkonia haasae]
MAMSAETAEAVIGDEGRTEIRRICEMSENEPLTEFQSERSKGLLSRVEVLVTGWGCPVIDDQTLAAAPRLRAIIHTAGSVKNHVTHACFDRGIAVVSAAAANARPVIEYTLAMILLEGKRVIPRAAEYRRSRRIPALRETGFSVGNYQRTVGILSASLIGRGVMQLLRQHDISVLLCDPYIDARTASQYGAELVSIEEVFLRSDIVSIHTPLLPATEGLVSRELIDSMPPGAVLINSARGAVVDQAALTDAAMAGRLRAVLDVTDPEVLPSDHPLWECENVLITPHLAGSQGNELERLRDLALAELRRWVQGEDLLHPVPHDALEVSA